RFVIHGWNQRYTDRVIVDICKAWLSRGDHNVIIVDWAHARTINYRKATRAVPKVGKAVASLINFLKVELKMSLEQVHIIGFSLGAHVAGFAGKNNDDKVQVIMGLDPALPFFSWDTPSERLCQNDAFYVESIHTSGGKLSFLKPIGDAAFYPNGGKKQPNCDFDLTGSCSHSRAAKYYAEAVEDGAFPAMKCDDYESAVNNDC
ncbi:CG6847, partial [Drosophila busckii]